MRLVGPGQERPAPPLCSACYQQKPGEIHVDFEAAWDGPNFKDGVMGENGETASNIPVSIDDLVICAGCLTTAYGMLPLPGDEQAEVDELRAQVSVLRGEAEKREDYVGKLEAAVEAKGERQRSRAPRAARA